MHAQVKSLANLTLTPTLFNHAKSVLMVLQKAVNHANIDIVEQGVLTLSDLVDHEYQEHQEAFIQELLQSGIISQLLKHRDLRVQTLEIVDELCEYANIKLYDSSIVNDVFEILNHDESDFDTLYAVIYNLVSHDVGVFCESFVEEMEILLVTLAKHSGDHTDSLDDIIDSIRLCLTTKAGYDNFWSYDGVGLILKVVKDGSSGFYTFLKIVTQLFDLDNEARNYALAEEVVNTDGVLRDVFKHMAQAKLVLKFLTSLLEYLPRNSDQRVRVVNKILSKDGKHLKPLINKGNEVVEAVEAVGDYSFDDLYLEKIEAGLDLLQLINLLFAWLAQEDDEVKSLLLAMRVDFALMRSVLGGYKQELEFNTENKETADTASVTSATLEMIDRLLMDQ